MRFLTQEQRENSVVIVCENKAQNELVSRFLNHICNCMSDKELENITLCLPHEANEFKDILNKSDF